MTLRDHGYDLDIRRLDEGAGVPEDYDNVEGVIILGGQQNTNESHPWLAPEREFIKGAHERGMPVVGICLGAELIAEALGGTVSKMAQPEVGLCEVDILPSGHADTMLAGVAWKAKHFQWHSYEVSELPPGATLLASSDVCKNQVFSIGLRTYGFQYHFEADRAMIEGWVEKYRGELHTSGVTSEEFAKLLDAHYEMFARLADRVCLNIVTCLLPQAARMASR